MMCIEASSSLKDTEPSSPPCAMTSNPNFADYVERIQQNLAVFSLSDTQATKYLRESNSIIGYNPRFIAVEILFHSKEPTKEGSGTKAVRRFDPHISDKLVEEATSKAYVEDLKRLYHNKKRFKNLNFYDPNNWKVPDYVLANPQLSNSTKERLNNLENDVKYLDRLYEKFFPSSSEEIPEIDPDDGDLHKLRDIFIGLLKRYEVEYFPTHIGATAAIYEAWKQGQLISLGNPAQDKEKFEKLIKALFLNTKGKKYARVMEEMAENLGLENPRIRQIGIANSRKGDLLSNQQHWVNRIEGKEWFVCLELSLIHKLRIEDHDDPTPANRYLIYYPLIIDDYWFAGVASIYSELNVDPSDGDIPEVFNRKKYAKIYNTVQSVSDTLKIARWEDARQNAAAQLRSGKSKDEVFFEVARDYFVCFSVGKQGESIERYDPSKTNKRKIYSGHGIDIYGPEWLSQANMPEKLKLIEKEIDGYDVDVSHIKGIYELVEDLAQEISTEKDKTKQEGKKEGIEEQSKRFAHQAAGLIQEIWSDAEVVNNLTIKNRTCLWQLRMLVDIWGSFDLEPGRPINEVDFPEWRDFSAAEILRQIAEMGLIHALRRATFRRVGATALDNKVRLEALKILRRAPEHVSQTKQLLGFVSPFDDSLPGWVTNRGFVLCFYHTFWQAAYHAFRAACDDRALPLPDSQASYLSVVFGCDQVVLLNAAVSTAAAIAKMTRDSDFFKDINDRLASTEYSGSVFEIEKPKPEGDHWVTKIFKTVKEG